MDRTYLNTNDKIKLSRNLDSQEFEEFEIQSVIGEGSSSVCYSAKLGEKSGRLKEFYPLPDSFNTQNNFNWLERTENNQLVISSEILTKTFKKMCADYLNNFKILDDARTQSGGLLLNNFVPVQEIYFGCSELGTASVYIWSQDDKHGLIFFDYVKDVRKNFDHQPNKKLFNVMRTLLTLTDCVKVFHNLGIVHCDLKPSNFLVTYDSNGEINPANISLFDLNSIYNLDSNLPCPTIGTEGFAAPELKQGRISNRSDLYSLGCILFNAIIISKDFNSKYHEEYFDNIGQLINHSDLINASVVNSNFAVQSKLLRILKKSLAHDPKKRYDNCEQLILDLKQTIALLTPSIQNDSLKDLNKKAIIVDDETVGISSPKIILQNLLYKKPLFKLDKQSPEINVITIGAGNFAQRFIDEVLQSAQIPFVTDSGEILERKISINTFSNNPDYDKNMYLNFRPAISKFVNVNGSLSDNCESYGLLNFCHVPQIFGQSSSFSVSDMTINSQIADEIVSNFDCDTNLINYIFVAVGDDQLNFEISKAFFEATRSLAMNDTEISFVVQDKDFSIPDSSEITPVYIAEKVNPNTINEQLERMAWNTHLSWFGSLNGVDLNKTYEEYLQRYNHESCLAFALSIRYKLMAIGINDTDYNTAALKFAEKIKENNLLQYFAYYEHRRWILEKLTLGWKPMITANNKVDYNHCILMAKQNGKPQDEKNYLHHCILHSNKNFILQSNPNKWDDPTDLDDLDKMSVELNLAFRRKADEFKRTQPLTSGDLAIIRYEITSFDKNIQIAFKKLEFYLKQILNGNKNHSRLFKSYIKEFLEKIKILPAYVQEIVKDRIENLRKDFITVVEANLKRDYKSYDLVLLNNIPFILTFKQPSIALPFNDGRMHGGANSEIFKNVASVSVLNPKKILFLYCFDEHSRLSSFVEKFESILHYFSERNIFSEISLVMAIKDHSNDDAKNNKFLQRVQKNLGNIHSSNFQFTLTFFKNYNEVSTIFLESLKNNQIDIFDGSSTLFSSNFYNGFFTKDIFSAYPYFEFNAVKKNFNVTHNCDHLKFISDSSHIRVNDLFALSNTVVDKFNVPSEYIDYHKALLKIYTNNQSENSTVDERQYFFGITNWNRLCNILHDYDSNIYNFFNVQIIAKRKAPSLCSLQYILPYYTKSAVERLIKILENYGLIEKDSAFIVSGDSVRIELQTKWLIEFELKRLFNFLGSTSGMVVPEFVNFKDIDGGIIIFFKDLKVNLNMSRETVNDFISKLVVNTLKQLAGTNFISNLRISPDNRQISFHYSSDSIRKLLTIAGMMLEVHIYFSSLKLGYFDDITPNFEFIWDEKSTLTNEFDCILTKGFSSMIVEAKARQSEYITQEILQKLSSLVDRFGIDSKKVLIANTDNLNPTQIERADKMGVTIVNNPYDIIHIGETLKKILEGKPIGKH